MRGKTHIHIYALLLVLALSGCASIQNGRVAQPIDANGTELSEPLTASGLRVSGAERSSLASPQLGAIELTFENTSAKWLRIDEVSLDFGSDELNARFSVPWGDQLTSWQAAVRRRQALNATNRAMALGALGIIGGAVAAASGAPEVKATGGLIALGAAGALATHRLSQTLDAAQHVAPFPHDHLLAGSFPIPPGLFAMKWILLTTSAEPNPPCLHSVQLKYRVDGEREEHVRLTFKGRSDWQRVACREWFGVWFR